MGLIIGKTIPMFIKGYPTISDKYNIAGATLTGSKAVGFGELVKHSSETGYYEAIDGTVTIADIAGFVMATNVKLADGFPGVDVKTQPGEAFNLLIDGFIAIDLASSAVPADIKAEAEVKVVLADGSLTTSSITAGTETLPGAVFTGTYEKHGSVICAEIRVK